MKKKQSEESIFIENILTQASKYCDTFRKPLYHYTNAEGLKDIINDGEIWGSHYKFSNDPTEIEYSYKLMIEILERYIINETDSRIKSFFEKYLEYQKIFVTYSGFNIFSASFSEKGDLLSQWRGYGDNSFGYCIGIDLFKIGRKSVGLTYPVSTNSPKIKLIKIIYDKKKQEEILGNYLDQLKEYINKNKNLKEDSGLLYGIYLVIFPLIACLFKDQHFEEEEEWRLIYTPLTIIRSDKLKPDELKLNYRANNKLIIPYVKINIKKIGSDLIPINEIVIGPKGDKTKSIMGIDILLKYKGYPDDLKSKIHKSSIPLT